PAGGAVPQLAGVTVDHGGDERIDDPQSRGRASGARQVRQAQTEVAPSPVLKAARPVGYGLPADAEEVPRVLYGTTSCEAQQGLSTALFAGSGDLQQRLQIPIRACGKYEWSHRSQDCTRGAVEGWLPDLSKNFWPPT